MYFWLSALLDLFLFFFFTCLSFGVFLYNISIVASIQMSWKFRLYYIMHTIKWTSLFGLGRLLWKTQKLRTQVIFFVLRFQDPNFGVYSEWFVLEQGFSVSKWPPYDGVIRECICATSILLWFIGNCFYHLLLHSHGLMRRIIFNLVWWWKIWQASY